MPITEKQARQAMAKIAQEQGISIFEVRREMEKAILAGLASTESEAIAFWRAIPRKGEAPTPEEFLLYMSERGI